ncbi:MAG: bifunctional precorrin-2 dehydrogenase/sirohydrochlorin ferrochelatase [Clostridiales bacterium]|nr:bifunctional precorrin-2 dehydrogenase/sirohydrochlorin ferrochelatase [Clostridiales bacterium]
MKNKGYFPLFMDISEKKIVVVGGGKIAARRVKTLSSFGNNITVVAPDIHPDISELARKGRVEVLQRAYQREDIYDAWMVLAATDDHKLNEEIYSVAKCLGALVNVASSREKCDFHFPGIVKKDSYVVGVNAAGEDHSGAAKLRKKIADLLESDEET